MAVSKKIELSQERLKQLFIYDEKNGNLINRITRCNRAVAGKIAGYLHKKGYMCVEIEGKEYRVHRLIWLYIYGVDPLAYQIDHINQKREDNRIENLRLVSNGGNQRNAKIRRDNTSGFTGVYWSKAANKWRTSIYINGKRKHLGYFIDLNDAIKVRKDANIKYDYHANHGK